MYWFRVSWSSRVGRAASLAELRVWTRMSGTSNARQSLEKAAVSGEYVGEIFYEDAGYWTRSKNHHHALTESCETYEVVGNIFEHKELLDAKK